MNYNFFNVRVYKGKGWACIHPRQKIEFLNENYILDIKFEQNNCQNFSCQIAKIANRNFNFDLDFNEELKKQPGYF